jgi:hypothetical protein
MRIFTFIAILAAIGLQVAAAIPHSRSRKLSREREFADNY